MSGEFTKEVSDRICNHMNDDHADAVVKYVEAFGNINNASSAQMLRIDAEGMDIQAQVDGTDVPVRIKFERTLADAKDAHVILVEMLKQIK